MPNELAPWTSTTGVGRSAHISSTHSRFSPRSTVNRGILSVSRISYRPRGKKTMPPPLAAALASAAWTAAVSSTIPLPRAPKSLTLKTVSGQGLARSTTNAIGSLQPASLPHPLCTCRAYSSGGTLAGKTAVSAKSSAFSTGTSTFLGPVSRTRTALGSPSIFLPQRRNRPPGVWRLPRSPTQKTEAGRFSSAAALPGLVLTWSSNMFAVQSGGIRALRHCWLRSRTSSFRIGCPGAGEASTTASSVKACPWIRTVSPGRIGSEAQRISGFSAATAGDAETPLARSLVAFMSSSVAVVGAPFIRTAAGSAALAGHLFPERHDSGLVSHSSRRLISTASGVAACRFDFGNHGRQ